MRELVEKLTGRKQPSESHEVLSSIIFGSGISMSDILDGATRHRLRVGLWPVISAADPESAMGIATVLAFLLESWPSITVYRLFAQLDGEPADFNWNVQTSQFSVDDWGLDDLDENVAVWGDLTVADNQYTLTLEIENDLIEDDVKVLKLTSESLGGLLTKLIPAAEEIADYLDAGEKSSVSTTFTLNDKPTASDTQELLKQAFQWELHLFLLLWGKSWSNQEVESHLKALTAAGEKVNPDFGAWLVAHSFARALSSIFAPLSNLLLQHVKDTTDTFKDVPIGAAILGSAVFKAGDSIQAYNLLETAVEIHPESVSNWLSLAELFRQNNELLSSIDAYQRAIESNAVSVMLYIRYAELMNLLHTNNLTLGFGAERNSASGIAFEERLVFVDPQDGGSQPLAAEAAEAYQAVLELDPNHVEAHYHLATYLLDQDNTDELWSQFALLVKNDTQGEYTRNIVDRFYGIEDISAGIKILQSAVQNAPERLDLHITLAAAYLVDEDSDAARVELEKARSIIHDDPQTQAEIDRLVLIADDPDFEARIGEITDLVNAGNEVSAEDVEFLEQILDETPSYSEGYVLLASAYLAWDETDDALEVLLDGQKHSPRDPEITMMLARVLWDSEAEDLAFDCLNKGLIHNPNHVGMLARTGQYLFEDGQDTAAKEFLARAEALNPADPVLRAARTHIARTLSDIDEE